MRAGASRIDWPFMSERSKRINKLSASMSGDAERNGAA